MIIDYYCEEYCNYPGTPVRSPYNIPSKTMFRVESCPEEFEYHIAPLMSEEYAELARQIFNDQKFDHQYHYTLVSEDGLDILPSFWVFPVSGMQRFEWRAIKPPIRIISDVRDGVMRCYSYIRMKRAIM